MSSGQFQFFAMPNEVLGIISRVRQEREFHGIVPLRPRPEQMQDPAKPPYWGCTPLDLALICEQIRQYRVTQVALRGAPLEHGLDLKQAFMSYPRNGFMAIDIPSIYPPVLIASYMVYKDDGQRPDLVSPKRLFEKFRSELKRAFPHHVIGPDGRKLSPKVWCSDGAVEYYRSGGVLAWSVDHREGSIPVVDGSPIA